MHTGFPQVEGGQRDPREMGCHKVGIGKFPNPHCLHLIFVFISYFFYFFYLPSYFYYIKINIFHNK